MKTGLYHPGEFKDNCGFGLIAHTKGQASHDLLRTAIESLTCMTHRGGIAADGKTGDGCGLLLQKPDSFLRAISLECFGREPGALYGVGMIFLSQDVAKAQAARATLENELTAQGVQVMGWRVVPTDSSCLGPMALDCLPQIEQVFVEANTGVSEQEFAVQLFRARRKAERSEEHTSELQSRENLVCRLLLEKKKNKKHI